MTNSDIFGLIIVSLSLALPVIALTWIALKKDKAHKQ
jgi:hypothetical protein